MSTPLKICESWPNIYPPRNKTVARFALSNTVRTCVRTYESTRSKRKNNRQKNVGPSSSPTRTGEHPKGATLNFESADITAAGLPTSYLGCLRSQREKLSCGSTMFSRMATAAAATMPEPPKIRLTHSGAPASTAEFAPMP